MSSKKVCKRKMREHFYGHRNITLLRKAPCEGQFGPQFEDLPVVVFFRR